MEDGLGREGLYISSGYHIKIKSNHQRRRTTYQQILWKNNSSLERLGKSITPTKTQEPTVCKLHSNICPHILTNIYISSATQTDTLDAYHLLSVQTQNKKLHHSYTDINTVHYQIMLTYEFKYSSIVRKKSIYNTILFHHFPHEYSIIIRYFQQVKHTKV